jgi:hypothetical protein
MYADKSFDNALQQSMVAEFSLAYDDIACAETYELMLPNNKIVVEYRRIVLPLKRVRRYS